MKIILPSLRGLAFSAATLGFFGPFDLPSASAQVPTRLINPPASAGVAPVRGSNLLAIPSRS